MSKKGQVPWNRGIPHSEETKKKMSDTLMGHEVTKETRARISKTVKEKIALGLIKKPIGLKGKHLSEERKRQMSEARKGKKFSEKHVQGMLQNHQKEPNALEIRFQEIIDEHNLAYKWAGNGSCLIGRRCPDFIHNEKNIAIEVFCRYWKEKDFGSVENYKKVRSEYFKNFNWEVIYFEEGEVNERYVLKKLCIAMA